MRKTKIVCTMGPATSSEQVLADMMLAGMNVARFNFSHGDHAEHKERLRQVCRVREKLGLPVATLLDTRGPEIRLGKIRDGRAQLQAGQLLIFTTQDVLGDESRVSITYGGLPGDVKPGDSILIDDGLIETTVQEVNDTEIICRVVNGGPISDRKGVNVPDAHLSMPYLSDQDRRDILFGIEHDFDFIAASFVRSADDVLQIRRLFDEHHCSSINIISKIENREGVDNIDEIIAVSDGIMVARGDMGVEIPLEEIPSLQKLLINKGYNAGKQVITATQMLESMIKNPRPTRAETTDVANAIYDGTSAIMLSGETSVGAWPVRAVSTMDRIAQCTEADIDYGKRLRNRAVSASPDVTNAISHATCTTAHDLGAAAIVTVSKSGKTVRMISKYRPACPIIGGSTEAKVCRQLNLSWGVVPLLLEEKQSTDELFEYAVDQSVKEGLVKQGELVVITAGVPLGVSGTTNLMKVHVAGHVLLQGKGVGSRSVSATLCVCRTLEEVKERFVPGDILVVRETNNDYLPYLRNAAAIITEEVSGNSHAAIAGVSLDIPVLLGAANATRLLTSGAFVTVDPDRGVVFCNPKG